MGEVALGQVRRRGTRLLLEKSKPGEEPGTQSQCPTSDGAGGVERLPKGVAHENDPIAPPSSCSHCCSRPCRAALAPTVPSWRRHPVRSSTSTGIRPPEVIRAEAAEIARVLRDREPGSCPPRSVHLSRVIAVEAHRAGLPPTFVLAVIDVESGGRNFAVSNAGARGLMQVLPATGEFVAAKIGVPWRGPRYALRSRRERPPGRELPHELDRALRERPHRRWPPTTGAPARSLNAFAAVRSVPRIYADRVLAAYAGTGREI